MRLDHVVQVFRKELLETVRDRRTLILMIGVPIVLYPLLALAVIQVGTLMRSKIESKELRIGITAAELPVALRLQELGAELDPAPLVFEPVSPEEVEARVLDDSVNAALVLPPEAAGVLAGEDQVEISILYDSSNVDSSEAQRRLIGLLGTLEEELIAQRLASHDLSLEQITPYALKRENLATAEKQGAFVLGGMLSFLLIVMALTGAFYPAVDLSAGEKERGTLETLLVAPVERHDIIMGKYLTVLTISIATAFLNLACMGLTVSQIIKTLGETMNVDFAIGGAALGSMVLTLLPLAAFFSALTLGTSTFARSFKEAQHYLTPIFMLVMFPAMLPVLPGIQLNAVLASLPVAGPALLLRELLLEEASALEVATVLISTLVYAGMALAWATDVYKREGTFFREGDSAGPRLKRPDVGAVTPSAVGAGGLFLFALALAGYFTLTAGAESGIGRALVAPQLLLYLGLPVAVAWWFRNDLKITFSLRLPALRCWLAVPVIFCGAFPLVLVLAQWQQSMFPAPPEYQEQLQAFITAIISEQGAYGSIALIALLPALCEEMFCRGFLLSGLDKERRRAFAIFGSAILFGVLHLDPSRLITTSCLGVLLAFVVIRSGSIYPAIVLHFLNNGTVAVFDASYRSIHPEALTTRLTEPLGTVLTRLEGWLSMPMGQLIIVAVASSVVLFGLVLLKPRSDEPTPPSLAAVPSS